MRYQVVLDWTLHSTVRIFSIHCFVKMTDTWKAVGLKEKIDIIKSIEIAIGKSETARRNKMSKTIWCSREKIKQASEYKSQRIKKIRNPVRRDVNQALIRWFELRRTENIPISCPILQAKAEDLSKRLHGEDFRCTTGWCERFKVCHNINVGEVSGEAGDVNKEAVVNWLTDKWPGIAQNNSCEDIFNEDETGLFYKMTADRILKFRGEKKTED
ncbi:unnamed protein product [Acanthoscelides obtectus]|uniref:HTH CENPB-type domain-containing protein n=1 Tax=Acanthoscelides obtectus TaxID=200917 RepID=A0A9P0LPI5_ACAOB|nr:unnamed protein product [Acanthoscelides obtectus]CAK1664344.1 Tigger transposable element-derived protein 4 [Acanthoscelides obtectus]